MENYVASQALSLAVSVAIGIAAAFLYDLLRAIRIRWKRAAPLTHVLDVVYVLAVSFLALWLTLVVGEGKLRLYMITGAVAGALIWWLFPSRVLRSTWDFWMDALVAFVRLLLRPLVWCKKIGKKGFSFLRKWFTINRDPKGEEASAMKKKRKTNPLILLVIAVLVIVLSVKIIQVYQKVSSAKAEETALEQQLAQQQAENDALRSDLNKAGDTGFIKRLAREFLGLAEEGERIFYDVNE